MPEWEVIQADCRDAMADMDADSVGAIVTDPPYGLSFMGKGWDHAVPGEEFWSEALRVAKPGAHLLAFGGTRLYHRLTCAIEDAGWEVRDCLMWLYGSGFPKSHDVSKAIDKAAGEVGQQGPMKRGGERLARLENGKRSGDGKWGDESGRNPYTTLPATDLARQWQGWGTALKPAWEPIILARKPLAGTVAANVTEHGTGALNIDGCRVGNEVISQHGRSDSENRSMSGKNYAEPSGRYWEGRWPANLLLDAEAGAAVDGQAGDRGQSPPPDRPIRRGVRGDNVYGGQPNAEGTLGFGYGDSGGPSRFFYCPKASKADRDEGLDKLPDATVLIGAAGHKINTMTGRPVVDLPRKNPHPTVKPTDLMRYLCRLITPPGGTVLDPFCGSGSTGKAAVAEGFDFVGIEMSDEYADIARDRIAAAASKAEHRQPELI